MKNISFSIKNLKIASLVYLALPVFLFFIFWLKPYYAIVSLLLLCFVFYKYIVNQTEQAKMNIPFWQFLALVLIVFLWVFISGAGGWGFQSPDLSKHSSIFKDIINNGTPTSYSYNDKTIFLSAYLGYYIPIPLLFGKLPWPSMMLMVAIWTYLGALIGLFWFGILSKSFSPLVFLFFILVGGIDFAGLVYSYGFGHSFMVLNQEFYEKIPFFAIMIDPKMMLLYQSNTHSLFWGPQHALVCWIASGLFLYEWLIEQKLQHSPFYLTLSLFWSPFIVMGLSPFLLYQAVKDKFKNYINASNLVLIPILIVIVLFVNSVPVGGLDKGLIFYKPVRLLSYFGEIKAFLFFLFFEVFVWAVPLYFIFKKYKELRLLHLLGFVVILLCLIPLYKLGKWNDFVQRVSMPALFFLWILVVRGWQISKSVFFKIVMVTLFCIGSWDSVYHILFSLKVTNYKLKYTAIPYDSVHNFVETSKREKWPIEQSFAPDSALFFRYLAK
jgi:hypothetical protein